MKKLILFLAITTSVFAYEPELEQLHKDRKIEWNSTHMPESISEPMLKFESQFIRMNKPEGVEVYEIIDSTNGNKIIGIIVYDGKNKRWICKEVNE